MGNSTQFASTGRLARRRPRRPVRHEAWYGLLFAAFVAGFLVGLGFLASWAEAYGLERVRRLAEGPCAGAEPLAACLAAKWEAR